MLTITPEKMQETGPTVYRPYPRRQERLKAYSGTLSRRNFRRLKATLGKFGQNVVRLKENKTLWERTFGRGCS